MHSAVELYKSLGGTVFTHNLNADVRRMDKRRQLVSVKCSPPTSCKKTMR